MSHYASMLQVRDLDRHRFPVQFQGACFLGDFVAYANVLRQAISTVGCFVPMRGTLYPAHELGPRYHMGRHKLLICEHSVQQHLGSS